MGVCRAEKELGTKKMVCNLPYTGPGGLQEKMTEMQTQELRMGELTG